MKAQADPKRAGTPPADAATLPAFLRWQDNAAFLSVKVQPRAGRNEIGEPQGGELKIKVTAPPVDSAANEALVRLLAEVVDCPRHQVELVRGHTARHKVVRISGLPADRILQCLGRR